MLWYHGLLFRCVSSGGSLVSILLTFPPSFSWSRGRFGMGRGGRRRGRCWNGRDVHRRTISFLPIGLVRGDGGDPKGPLKINIQWTEDIIFGRNLRMDPRPLPKRWTTPTTRSNVTTQSFDGNELFNRVGRCCCCCGIGWEYGIGHLNVTIVHLDERDATSPFQIVCMTIVIVTVLRHDQDQVQLIQLYR